ncbi:hypothetical protein K438DRAFT_1948742 [Mycena galopus ATCC 62051]|nr:hypothetical protein K438DRAFT_1948742 [Mycena galopus ATCC 62051]
MNSVPSNFSALRNPGAVVNMLRTGELVWVPRSLQYEALRSPNAARAFSALAVLPVWAPGQSPLASRSSCRRASPATVHPAMSGARSKDQRSTRANSQRSQLAPMPRDVLELRATSVRILHPAEPLIATTGLHAPKTRTSSDPAGAGVCADHGYHYSVLGKLKVSAMWRIQRYAVALAAAMLIECGGCMPRELRASVYLEMSDITNNAPKTSRGRAWKKLQACACVGGWKAAVARTKNLGPKPKMRTSGVDNLAQAGIQ